MRHGLRAAAADGALWNIRVTSVPEPENTRKYIEDALAMREAGNRFAFAVTKLPVARCWAAPATTTSCPRSSGWKSAGPGMPKACQRSHVNTTCKLLLLTHAFEVLGCHVVGWRTDNFNFASQAAIERLGAKKDGIIRGHALRRDGTIRDTVMYSMRSWRVARGQGAIAVPAEQ
jgi:RimJ/RimL family protein N-acetyltransferase